MAETKITKNLCMIFIDTSDGSGSPTWKRVDKSTILTMVMNAEHGLHLPGAAHRGNQEL